MRLIGVILREAWSLQAISVGESNGAGERTRGDARCGIQQSLAGEATGGALEPTGTARNRGDFCN